jgi:hypothetical protein
MGSSEIEIVSIQGVVWKLLIVLMESDEMVIIFSSAGASNLDNTSAETLLLPGLYFISKP